MGVLFRGLVNASGTHDSGKSTFAFECGASPEDIAFFDNDLKGRHIVEQIKDSGRKLGFYKNLVTETSGKKEIETHKICLESITQMESEQQKRGKQFEALIWDTWTPFETTFHPFIVTNPGQFRTYWSPNGVIKGAEQWKSAFKYESEVLDRLLHCAKMVILTAHLKPEVVGNRKTGKMIPDVKAPVVEKSMLRVYLMPSAKGPKPIGLILKRISKNTFTDNGIGTISILPRRMEPFTWAEIRKFWDKPVGDRPLTESELPNAFEFSILDGTLTEEQKRIMEYQEVPFGDTEETAYIDEETVKKIRDMRNNERKPVPVIAKMLGFTVADINKALE
jgi:hypothetical protein